MQMTRLFEIVYILMNQKNITARILAEHFEVSQRTIYRDIDALCEAGIPIYTNKGKGGGICLMEHFVLNKSVLSEQEQSNIISALQGLKATNVPETEQVLSKLNTLFGNSNPNWIEVEYTNWSNSEEDKRKFASLKGAIINRNIIEFDYYNSYGQESRRTVEPQKMVFRGQAWYLLGYCKKKEDIRYFKISRIRNLLLLEEYFEQFSSSTSVEDKENDDRERYYPKQFSLLLKIDAAMAYRVYDEFPIEQITKNPDGSFLIHTQMPAGGWLYGYLMSYEEHMEIIEPKEIRDELVRKMKAAIKRYDII